MKKRNITLLIFFFLISSAAPFCYGALQPISSFTTSYGADTGGLYINLNWTAAENADPADSAANFIYYVYYRKGKAGMSSTSSDSQLLTPIGTSNLYYQFYPADAQDFSFIIYAVESGGLHTGDDIFTSAVASKFFLWLTRVEGAGGLSWQINFWIPDNSTLTNIRVYRPGVTLVEDTYGHPVHNAAYDSYVRSVVSRQTLSAGNHSFIWDCKDGAGNYVSNFTYPVIVEAMADDTNIIGYCTTTIAVNIQTSELGSFEQTIHSYPNPAKGTPVTFSYYLGVVPAEITIDVYSVTGELVWTSGTMTKNVTGTVSDVWNCINSSGAAIGSDIYIYRITKKEGTSTITVSKKFVYVR